MDEDKKEPNTENAEQETSVKEENLPAGEEGKVGENQNEKMEENSLAEKQKEELIRSASGAKKEDIKNGKVYPNVIPGANVRIYQKIKEKKEKEEKERIQIFEGIVLARKGGNSAGATITVQKICKGGFEVKKIFPIHLPTIAKIEVLRQAKVRRAKLKFLNKNYKKKLKYA